MTTSKAEREVGGGGKRVDNRHVLAVGSFAKFKTTERP
jgi:hypothetical protein